MFGWLINDVEWVKGEKKQKPIWGYMLRNYDRKSERIPTKRWKFVMMRPLIK